MDEILTELKKLGSFTAWAWSTSPASEYGTVAMDGQNALRAGDRLGESVQEGTIDWFTRNPASTVPEGVEAALDELGASWYLTSIQYESDTGLIHYEWVWQYG